MQRIAEGLYLLEAGRFVNAYLIEGAKDLTLVDSGHSRCSEALLDELKSGGFRLEDVQRIVLTHSHADHAGGAAALLRKHRMRVLAHPLDIPVLQGKEAPAPLRGWKGKLAAAAERLWYRSAPVDVLVPVSPRDPVRAMPRWQVLHTPGHTQGSISLFEPVRGILICGDALSNFRGRLRGSSPEFTADDARAAQSLGQLAALGCETLCPGHGPVVREGAFRRIRALAAAAQGFAR